MNTRFDLSRFLDSEPTPYRRLSWSQRRSIDWRILAHIILSRSGLRIFLLAAALELSALTVVWKYDLGGWRGDLLRVVAIVFVWLWLARSRHRHLQQLGLTKR